MLSPAQLATYAAVCETGSFELAAARVGVTPSAVSQRMRALAEAAGGALFERLAPAYPTALGRRLLRHANDIAALEAALMEEIGRGAGPRPVRLAINADSLETWAVYALARVEGFCFDIVIEDQDHAAALLRRGEVSAAVTAAGDPVPGCDAKPLGALRYRAVCAPAFRDRWFPDGLTPAALAQAPVLQFNAKDGLQARWVREVAGSAVALPPAHRLSATSPFQIALRAGLGWGLNPEPLLAADLAAGRLVDLGPSRPLDTPLDLQVSRSMANAIAPVIAALRRTALAALLPP
ncbi:MAG: ArgP/LysG family DNA-binding transcriptional regulator [Pseudomonadota bacterium]